MQNNFENGWVQRRIDEIASINPRRKIGIDNDTDVSFLPMECLKNDGGIGALYSRKLKEVNKGYTPFENGDVLFAKITPCMENGKGAYVSSLTNGIGFGSTEYHVIRANSNTFGKFLYYHTISPDFRRDAKLNMIGSAGQQRTPADFIAAYQIGIPSLPEQKKISEILSAVDIVIEKNEVLLNKLIDLKNALMQQLFSKGIGHKEFKPIPLWKIGKREVGQRIPVAWKLVKISGVAKLESGHTPSRSVPNYWNGNLGWISLADTGKLDYIRISDTEHKVTQEGINNSSARLLPKGTVVFSRTASIGHCSIMSEEMATSQDFANYICGNSLHNEYLYYYFMSMQDVWKKLASGSTHQTIYMPIFEDLEILLPPLNEQIKIAEILKGVDNRITNINTKKQALCNLKKALMQDLLSGKVRIKSL